MAGSHQPEDEPSLAEPHKQATEELAKLSETQRRILLTLADIIIDAYLEDRAVSDAETDER
jgi:hypothetical protein